MKQKLITIANFLKLLDETGSISLSNIAMIVVLAKMALTQQFSLAEAAILLPVIGNYAFKGYHQRKHRQQKDQAVVTLNDQFAAVVADVEKLKIQGGFRAGTPYNNRNS